jgi:release factor glutamine methyltransferase
MQTVGNVIKSFRTDLKEIYPDSEIQAITELVFEHFLKYSKTELVIKSEHLLDETYIAKIEQVLARLKKHEPIQYMIGQTDFYNCKFKVNSSVLIPRQETEELVDWIISEHKNISKLKILDIGTGSGCIAISLAFNILKSNVFAYDISESALEVARQNAEINNVKIIFSQINILDLSQNKENQQFDIIVSNPPYVLFREKDKMHKNVLDFEPGLALFVNDNDPLLFYKAIIHFAKKNLKSGGKLYFEINESFGNEVTEKYHKSGFTEVVLKKDINGKNRMISGKLG